MRHVLAVIVLVAAAPLVLATTTCVGTNPCTNFGCNIDLPPGTCCELMSDERCGVRLYQCPPHADAGPTDAQFSFPDVAPPVDASTD